MARRDSGHGATIKTLEYLGRKVDLSVSSRGIFYACMAEERIEAKSLDGLVDKVKRIIKHAGRIAVPVTIRVESYDAPPEFRDVDLIGYNSRSRRPIVKDADGDTDTIYNGDLCRRLTPEEQAAYIAVWEAKAASEKQLEQLNEEYLIDAQETMATAAAVIDAQPDPADEAEGAPDGN
jgi:hypothetical protein